jgi:hypothetical protein
VPILGGVPEDRQTKTPTERLITRKREGEESGYRLSEHSTQYQRTLEGYLQAGNRPRWMERLGEIQAGTSIARRRIEQAYARLQEEVVDPAEFARRWREAAAGFRFDEVNLLIHQHNEWFPIERRLAIDPRTRDYVKINGRDYRRRELDAAWVLEQFPAERRR